MLDLPIPAWAADLAPGDIVLFRFPVSEDAERAPVKRRPCLIVDRRSFGDDAFLDLAYGTAADGKANCGFEVRVHHEADFVAAGLTRPTRFVCARRVLVHPRHPGFTPYDDAGPRIGSLPPSLRPRLDDLHDKIRRAMIEGWRSRPKLTVLNHPFAI